MKVTRYQRSTTASIRDSFCRYKQCSGHSNSNDKGWANFSNNAAVNVAENASKLKEGIKSVASSLSDKLVTSLRPKRAAGGKRRGQTEGGDKSKSVEQGIDTTNRLNFTHFIILTK